jgi:hypothetical protein
MRGFFWSSRFDPGQNITWQVRLELQVLQVRRQAQQRVQRQVQLLEQHRQVLEQEQQRVQVQRQERVQQVQRLLFYRKRPKQLQR